MKMFTNFITSLLVDSWPPNQLGVACPWSFLVGGQLSTDKLILQLLYVFIVPFPVWAGINFDSISCFGWDWFEIQPTQEMELSKSVLTSCHLWQLITVGLGCIFNFLHLCVCKLSVCSQLLIWNPSFSLNILEYSRYSKREMFHIKTREHTPNTNTHTKVRIELLRN